jgi:hypothetical protein
MLGKWIFSSTHIFVLHQTQTFKTIAIIRIEQKNPDRIQLIN